MNKRPFVNASPWRVCLGRRLCVFFGSAFQQGFLTSKHYTFWGDLPLNSAMASLWNLVWILMTIKFLTSTLSEKPNICRGSGRKIRGHKKFNYIIRIYFYLLFTCSMGKQLASALYKENIIEAKESQKNAFFPLILFFYCFDAAEVYFFLKFGWFSNFLFKVKLL